MKIAKSNIGKLTLLSILTTAIFITAVADVEMSYSFSLINGRYQGNLQWKNRQDKYYWNNDVLPIVAVGYSLKTNLYTIPGRVNYQTLDKDADGLTQYRYLYPRGERMSLMPGELETYGGPDDVPVYLYSPLDSTCPYPRYPHIVLKDKPWYGLNYPDTYKYAPPLDAGDIDATSGVVSGQSDYYDSKAWVSRDDAPLLVSENHHPTQIWIGMPHVKKGESIKDAMNPADYYKGGINDALGNIQDVRGSYIAPNNPSGEGVSYKHTNGEGPGGLMFSMAISWGQEIFGFDMRLPIAIASKESWFCVFWDSSHALFPEWGYAGTDPLYGMGACNTNPYQITTESNIQIAYQSMPDYLNHNISMQEFFSGVNGPGVMKTNIVNSSITFYTVLATGYYGYFSVSRAHRLDDFAANAADDFSMLRIVTYGYNQGKNRPEIFKMRYKQDRTRMLKEKNLSNSDGITGAYEYAPKMIDLMRRIGTCDNVYDWGITWGDIEDFCADLRKHHYANDIPTNTQWTAMKDEMKSAFNKMKGKAPTDGLKSDQISFRYNWLTMIRVMKSFLPQPGVFLPRGSAFYSAFSSGDSKIDFLGAYHPNFYYVGKDQDHESEGPLPDTNWAAEIYWVEPHYKYPSKEQGFPIVGKFPNGNNFTITIDVLDDGTGGGKVSARYCISPGDPAKGGQSLWLDGVHTGGSPKFPVGVDWVDMDDIGSSQSPSGGIRFSATFDANDIKNETRRLYVEANDNSGYRTISWVDVFFEDDGKLDLAISADPPSGTHFVLDTTVTLTVKDENGAKVNGVIIYYTTDGSDPTKTSYVYTAPIKLSGNIGDIHTIKALAIASGYTDAEGEWTYIQDAASAWIKADPDDGTTFKVSLSIKLTSNTDTIFYTTDGSDPKTSSTAILYSAPFTISDEVVIVKGIAKKQGFTPASGQWTYYKDSDSAWIKADPVDGTSFTGQLTVKLSSNADSILYTIDGTDPKTNGVLYTGSFVVSDVLSVVKGYAFGDAYIPVSGTWKYFKESDTAWVDADPGDGTPYGDKLTITLSTNANKIYYTTDGSTPDTTKASQLYNGSFIISGGDVTVKAIAIGDNMEPGDGSWTYIQATLPKVIATPPGQDFAATISVLLSLSSPWSGATIYYTLNNSGVLDESGTAYTGKPIVISQTTTLRARAFADNALPSDTCVEHYTQVFAIDTAWYFDKDGNGTIDYAQLMTNKKPDNLPLEIKMTNPFNSKDIQTISGKNICWENNDPSTKTIEVKLPKEFPFSHKTYFLSGNYGQIKDGKYLKEPFLVKDKIAPVIDNAKYYPGKVINNKSFKRADDTLVVVFTENVSGINSGTGRFFNFITNYGTSYYCDLKKLASTGNQVTFTVENNSIYGVEYPSSSDSIWIRSSDNIGDVLGNNQVVSQNRHAPMKVFPKPWFVKVMPLTPFITMDNPEKISKLELNDNKNISDFLSSNNGLLIDINFLSDLSENEKNLDCKMIVQDPVGNLVISFNGIGENNPNFKTLVRTIFLDKQKVTQLLLFWTGYNHNDRRIGAGSYRAVFEISDDKRTVIVKKNICAK